MKLSKLLLAVVGATVLLGALVSSASAGRLSSSENRLTATWARMNFSGGLGTVECEVVLAGTLHSRSIVKTIGTLIGFITAANVSRCSRGGATVLRETLPWRMHYNGFGGSLPNISSIATTVLGSAFRIREPTFGITCLALTEAEEPATGLYNISGGAVVSATVGGEIETSCGISGGLSGTSSSVSPTGVRITLI